MPVHNIIMPLNWALIQFAASLSQRASEGLSLRPLLLKDHRQTDNRSTVGGCVSVSACVCVNVLHTYTSFTSE